MNRCDWKKCRETNDLIGYYNRRLCQKHWKAYCDMQDEGKEDAARAMFGMKPRSGDK